MVFKASSPNAKVLGRNILIYLSGMGAFEMMGRSIIEAHGIDPNPKEEEWCNFQNFLDALKEIAEKTGKSTITMMGTRVATFAKFSPEINTLEQALQELSSSYHKVHQDDSGSNKEYIKVEDNKYKVIVKTPYPCDFDLGYLRGLVKRFVPQSFTRVLHDDNEPCRAKGAESCTYWIMVDV